MDEHVFLVGEHIIQPYIGWVEYTYLTFDGKNINVCKIPTALAGELPIIRADHLPSSMKVWDRTS